MLKGPHYPVAYSMRHITLIHLKKSGNLNLFHAFVKSSTVCRSELVISIPNGPLKLVVRSIFVQVPTLNSHHRAHDPDTIVLSNSPNRYFTCTSLQNAFFSKHFFQSKRSDDSHLLLLCLNCHTKRAAVAAVMLYGGNIFISTGKRALPGPRSLFREKPLLKAHGN